MGKGKNNMAAKTIIAFVPVLHKGYVELFKKYAGASLLLLQHTQFPECDKLSRDLRAIDPEELAPAIMALGSTSEVLVATPQALADIPESTAVIMPDEDISHIIAETYMPKRQIQYENTFLRWDGMAALNKKPVDVDQHVSREALDRQFMDMAQEEADKSADFWRRVGAVAVQNGKVLFVGHNTHMPHDLSLYVYGDPRSNFNAGEHIEVSSSHHGEKEIVAAAARQGVALAGADLYVTTFPCNNCAMDVARAGIKRVFFRDGYSQTGAMEIFKAAGVELIKVEG